MVILRDKIRFYEGQKLLDTLAETWDFFFSDVLPMLQAIFYPVQGKEPPVRQLALLHFRNIITLNIKLEDALSRSRARIPPSIGVHESKGVTEDYLKLETLLQKVVSPYLGTYGLYSSDGALTHSSCILEKRFFRRSKSGDILAKNPVVRSKSYNNPLLTPVAEYETEGTTANSSSIRRHSVSEMTSCGEMPNYSNLTTITDNGSKSSMLTMKILPAGEQERISAGSMQCMSDQSKGLFYPTENPARAFELGQDSDLLAIAPTASPENIVDQILESIDSDSDGIFIDFGQNCSGSPGYNMDVSRQSVV
ncbi:hypothetical protein E2320_005959 [Naja naja]|nr:hypothetical protein E2320_005959 [Naja naja]